MCYEFYIVCMFMYQRKLHVIFLQTLVIYFLYLLSSPRSPIKVENPNGFKSAIFMWTVVCTYVQTQVHKAYVLVPE